MEGSVRGGDVPLAEEAVGLVRFPEVDWRSGWRGLGLVGIHGCCCNGVCLSELKFVGRSKMFMI